MVDRNKFEILTEEETLTLMKGKMSAASLVLERKPKDWRMKAGLYFDDLIHLAMHLEGFEKPDTSIMEAVLRKKP